MALEHLGTPEAPTFGLDTFGDRGVCGGDRSAVDAVLSDPRLVHLVDVRVEPWLAVPDPRRSVLDQAVLDGASVSIEVA